jgi:hypothetical protein
VYYRKRNGILKDKSKLELNQQGGMVWPYLCKLRERRVFGRKY